jgi:hypothetical protein
MRTCIRPAPISMHMRIWMQSDPTIQSTKCLYLEDRIIETHRSQGNFRISFIKTDNGPEMQVIEALGF